MTPRVIWKPLPGSQTRFLTCPIYETLLEGTRGGGKTDTLLMDFAQHVGTGFGEHWRGVLFRLTYPQLADVVAKSKRWFYQIFPGAKFNESEYVWKWPTGEQLFFRYGESEDDYWNYHGHEYCVAVDTRVKTENGWVPIGQLRPGDRVWTLDGVRSVTHVFEPKLKECVRAYVYDDHRNLVGVQVQSVDHRLLTSVAGPDSPSSAWSRTVLQSGERSSSWQAYKSLPGADRETREEGASASNQRSSGTACRPTLQAPSLPPQQSAQSARQPLPGGQGGSRVPESIQSPAHGKSPELSQGLARANGQKHSDRLPPGAPAQSHPGRGASSASAYEQRMTIEPQGSLPGYRPSGSSDGARSRDLEGIGRGGAPSLDDAAAPVRVSLLADVLGSEHTDSQSDAGLVFDHPYTGEPVRARRLLSGGWVVYEPCGPQLTVDITVETSNHYITETGLINKNCWQGFEELTNWRDSSFFEAMASTCRSSYPGMPRKRRATCNPFGRGHGWVKERFDLGIDGTPAGTVLRREGEKPRVAIHSSIHENKILLANDPEYLKTLEALKDPNRRKAWLEGDWDIHVGSFFEGVWDAKRHVVEPFAIPPSWKVWKSMDWGFAAPYAVLWLAMDPDGCIYVWRELYGAGEKLGEGSREPADKVAAKIREIEKHDERNGYEYRMNLADPAIFSNTGTNNTIGGIFRAAGVKWQEAWNGKGSIANGAQEIMRLLAEDKLKIFKTCKHLIRTLPSIGPDDLDPEKYDTKGEDHAVDALRYGVMRRRRQPDGEQKSGEEQDDMYKDSNDNHYLNVR